MSCELEKVQNKVVLAWFKVLSQYLPGGAEENHEKFEWESSRSPKQDSSLGTPERETGVILL
jgi:hypothetical protein